jgi:DNA-binding transcriptional MerR regulator
MTVDRLTADEVAERAGTTSEHIALLAKVGILKPEDDGTYPRRDVLRARFVLGLDAMGIDANAVADALASGDLTLGYVEIGGRRPPRSNRTFGELSGEIDIPYEMLERIYVAFGLPAQRPTVRAGGGPAPHEVHPRARRRRIERRGCLAAGARVGR